MLKKINIKWIIYIIYFFLIALFFSKAEFYIQDDVIFNFPVITKDYFNFYKNYFNDFGLFRPVALIYYYSIYNFNLIFPYFSHLIPLLIFSLTSFLFYKLLYLQRVNKKISIILSILFLSLPFSVETYIWFSANASLFVLLIFFLQIFIIEKELLKKYIIFFVVFFQIISALLYESTIFMSFALSYLLLIKGKIKNKFQFFIVSATPIFIYILSKLLIKPQFETRSTIISFSTIISHWKNFILQFSSLFSNFYLKKFWLLEFKNGFDLMKNNIAIFGLITIFFIILGYLIFKKETDSNINGNYNKNIVFWFIVFVSSLIPLSWQIGYLPFRTLLLPIISLLICFSLIFNKRLFGIKYLSVAIKIFFMSMIFAFIMMQISMVSQYIKQYAFDKKIVLEINKKLEDSGFEHPYRSNLLLINFPNNNVGRYVYGDYIYSLFHNFWSAKALLDLNSGSFLEVGIEIKEDQSFASRISKDELINLRPLTIMSYTDNQSCLTGECLKVEAVYQKPY